MDFPFVTQIGNAIVNDCHAACVAMHSRGYRFTSETAESIARKNGLANKTAGGAQIKAMLKKEKIDAEFKAGVGLQWHREQWAERKPTIALVSYEHMPYGDYVGDFAHWLVAVEETERGVVIHDPLHLGPVTISPDDFNLMISSVAPGNGAAFQAVVALESVPMAGMGYNAQISYIHENNWPAFLDSFKDNPPAFMLLTDTFGGAKEAARVMEFKRRYPNTRISYRRYLGDNQQNTVSPEQWLNMHRWLAGTGIYATINNEPDFRASKDWHIAVIKLAFANNIKVSVGGYSVGTPAPDPLQEWLWAADMLRLIASRPDMAQIDLHEYMHGWPWPWPWSKEWMDARNWPAGTGSGFHMGRHVHLDAACKQLGIKTPDVVIGEFGFDLMRDIENWPYGNMKGMRHTFTSYEANGIDAPQAYGAGLLEYAWKRYHKPYPYVRGQAFFTINDTPQNDSGQWPDFNAWHYPTFRSIAARLNFAPLARAQEQPPVTFTPIKAGKYTYTGPAFNVRANRGTVFSVVTTLNSGDVLEITSAVTGAMVSGYYWQPVTVNGKSGYVATSFDGFGARLTPYVEPPKPEQPPQTEIDNAIGQLNQLRETLESTLALIDPALSVLTRLKASGEQVASDALVIATIEVDTDDIEATTRIVPPLSSADDDSEGDNDESEAA